MTSGRRSTGQGPEQTVFGHSLPFAPRPIAAANLGGGQRCSSPLGQAPLHGILPDKGDTLTRRIHGTPQAPVGSSVKRGQTRQTTVTRSQQRLGGGLLSPTVGAAPGTGPPSLEAPRPAKAPLAPDLVQIRATTIGPITTPILATRRHGGVFRR